MTTALLIAFIVALLLLGADTIYENDDGIAAILNASTGKAISPIGTGTLRLFTAPTSVSHSTLFAAMTEATFTGYASVALTGATWASAAVSAHVASAAYGAGITFTRTAPGAPQTIYGWYLTDAANTKLYACALFASGPYIMANAGDSITVGPSLSHQSLN
jgi:hypothetical protein